MTYKRPEIAINTIKSLLNQTLPPEKLLIIDNDPECSARHIADNFEGVNIDYFAMGYNSGPAGAANKGLELLADEGYQWIAWIDDDDPPVFNNLFEKLLNLAESDKSCACVGAVGQFFSFKKGLVKRVPDEALMSDGILEVDFIAGGMIKIVNGDIIKMNKHLLPDAELFFGFEDLDMDIKLKQQGYKLLVDKIIFREHRQYFNKWDSHNFRKPRSIQTLWRNYYSIRSLLFIFSSAKLYTAFIFTLFRYLLKCLLDFKFGFRYGIKSTYFNISGIIDFCIGRKGVKQLRFK